MSTMTAKCPMYLTSREKMIKCGQNARIRHEFATKEDAKEHMKKYCDTMEFEKCQFYKELIK